jgi:hypothetical protein
MQITDEDDLEVRNVEGESQFVTPVVKVDGDIIVTHFGNFRICGRKNVAGEDIFEHIPRADEYSALHAVLSKD